MKPAEWTIVLSPARAIYGRFWREARWMLVGIAVVVLASAAGNVATPFLFSRLIDQLGIVDLATALAWAFIGYAALRGLSTALAYSVNYLSIMAAENLNFIAANAFFERLLRKPVGFFIEHNPVEIQQARNDGQNAIYGLVQLALIVFIPGIAQIVFSIALLGAVINAQIVLIVVVYGAVFVALTYFANNWTRPLLDAAIKAGQENSKFVGNAVNAMETLRYFNGDRWVSERFAQKAETARASWVAWARRRVTLALLFGGALALQLGVHLRGAAAALPGWRDERRRRGADQYAADPAQPAIRDDRHGDRRGDAGLFAGAAVFTDVERARICAGRYGRKARTAAGRAQIRQCRLRLWRQADALMT